MTVKQEEVKQLDDYKWKNRIVLYFPSSENPDFAEDDALQAELEERKLLYFVFSDSLQTNSNYGFSSEYIKSLNNQYRLGSRNDCWVLIGLDGGIKVRREEEINWDFIFQTVDAMPMRQTDIRKKYL